MSRTHAHIGTGKFGLGFVGYFSSQCGFDTLFFNRASDLSRARNLALKEEKKYTIEYFDDEKRVESIGFSDLRLFSGETNHLPEVIADPATSLLTVSIGSSQLRFIAPFIAQGIAERASSDAARAGSSLYIIACENGERCSTALKAEVARHLSSLEGRNVKLVDCIVDQICEGIDDTIRPVKVRVESHREWIIEQVDTELPNLLNHPSIRYVRTSDDDDHSPLRLYNYRKLWLLNGFHLALAILGVKNHREDILIREVFDLEKRRVNAIKEELVRALRTRDSRNTAFSEDDLREYIETVANRFINSPDECRRILSHALFGEKRIKTITQDIARYLGEDVPLSQIVRRQETVRR